MATIQLRTRIDGELHRKSEAVLKSLGLDAGAFVSMALAQLVNRRGVPFAVTESDEEYFKNEYGLKQVEMERAGRRMRSEYVREKHAGKVKEIKTAADLVP